MAKVAVVPGFVIGSGSARFVGARVGRMGFRRCRLTGMCLTMAGIHAATIEQNQRGGHRGRRGPFWRGSMRGLAGVASVRCIPCRAGKDGDVDLNPTLAENARL
jgi:hypothetical protein